MIKKFIESLPEDRQQAIYTLRKTVLDNIPDGFEENFKSNMLHYTIPLTIYPDGYHCTKNTPLPFISIASQKNFIALYHMGIYADKNLYDWFIQEYPKYCKTKLDMGKSCIRFKKMEEIPYPLIAELMQKMTVEDWVGLYEKNFKK